MNCGLGKNGKQAIGKTMEPNTAGEEYAMSRQPSVTMANQTMNKLTRVVGVMSFSQQSGSPQSLRFR